MHKRGKSLRKAEENQRLDFSEKLACCGRPYLDNLVGQKNSLPKIGNHGILIKPQQLGGFYYGQRARKILGLDHG